MNNFKRKRLLLFVGIGGGGTLFLSTIIVLLASQTKPTQTFPSEETNVVVSPTPQNSSFTFKTFTNAKYGYTVKYPASWYAREFDNAFFIDASTPFDAYPQSLVDVSVLVYDKWNQDIQKALQAPIGKTLEKTIVSGFAATRVNETDTTYIFKGGYIYALHAEIKANPNPGNIKAIQDIVDSFTFTDQKQDVITSFWSMYQAIDAKGNSLPTAGYKLPPSVSAAVITNQGDFKQQTINLPNNTILAVIPIGTSLGNKTNPDDFINVAAKNNYAVESTTLQNLGASELSGVLTQSSQSQELGLSQEGAGKFRSVIVKIDEASGFAIIHYMPKDSKAFPDRQIDFAQDDELFTYILTTFTF